MRSSPEECNLCGRIRVGANRGSKVYRMISNSTRRTGHLIHPLHGRRGMISEERDELNKAFDRSRSRLLHLNIGPAIVRALACALQICILLLDY